MSKHYDIIVVFAIIKLGDTMNDLLKNLNEKQLEAVIKTEGPVMAIAGAGSGKTSVLTSRIAYLILELGVDPDRILALTFTNKAANEMKKRIKEHPSYNVKEPSWVSTFHAMCVRFLRKHHVALGYRKNFQILDDDDTTQIVKARLKDMNVDLKMFKPKDIKSMIQKVKTNRTDVSSYDAGVQVVLSTAFKKYQETLINNHLMDFDDLLLNTIKLFEEHEEIRQQYEDYFQYVLIDEFQDTNDIQYDLVKLILGKNKNIFIVGDEDQSIYKFRGANIRNINKFKSDYKGYHLVLLEQNYRSTNTILDAANGVISKNKSRIVKNLFSTKGKGENITFFKGTTSRDEVEYVGLEIMKKVRKGYSYNDFAILYRANNISRQFEDVFLQKHIPYRIYGNTSFFKRKEIKDLTAYLRLVMESDDEVTFERVITTPRRGVGTVTLDKLKNFRNAAGYTMYEAVEHCEEVLSKSAKTKLMLFVEQIKSFRKLLNEVSFNDFIDRILIDSGYLLMLEQDDKKDIRIENLMEFKTMLAENEKTYAEYTREEMLMFLLEEVTLKSEEKQSDLEDAVTMLTLHAAKGLEFRVVFIVNLESGIFPSSRVDSMADLEEERRLMYVGITRAKEKLYLTNSKVRQTFGEISQTVDSMFINEIDKELIEIKGYSEYLKPKAYHVSPEAQERTKKMIQRKKENLNNYQENELNKGDKVEHSKFGPGIVITIVGDNATIAFGSTYGIKTLLKDHKAIKKL
jgi:DNA helicase-2/ATP-dependent DNA helicase PcrA